MFCCTLLYVPSSFAIILMGKRELVALLSLSSWCLLIVVWLFLAVPWGCLRFVIVVFPDHTHLLFLTMRSIWITHTLIRLTIKISIGFNARSIKHDNFDSTKFSVVIENSVGYSFYANHSLDCPMDIGC